MRQYSPDSISEKNDGLNYYFSNKESADEYLSLLHLLLDSDTLPHNIITLSKDDLLPIKYMFNISNKDHEQQFILRQSHDMLIKSVRFDSKCFIRNCILSITPTPVVSSRKALRIGEHKELTVYSEGVFNRFNKHKRFKSKEEFDHIQQMKKERSKHQSTSLTFAEKQASVFGIGSRESKLVILSFDPEDNIYNRLLIYDTNTVNRPYEFDDQQVANLYHEKMAQTLYSDYNLFKEAIQISTKPYNEALYYLRWNINTSAVSVASNTFESRCISQYYASLIMQRLKSQYKELGKMLPNNYHVPIQFYLPNSNLHGESYTQLQQEKDKTYALSLFNNIEEFEKKIKSGNPEFLLLLPENKCNELLNRTINGIKVLNYLAINGFFEVVNAIYENTDSYKKTSLKEYWTATNAAEKKVMNDDYRLAEQYPIWVALERDYVDFIPVLQYQLNYFDEKGNTPLIAAIMIEDLTMVKKMINAKPDLNLLDSNYVTPLIIACIYNYSDIARELILAGANLNVKDPDGNTALMFAILNDNLNLSKALLEHNADVDIDILGMTTKSNNDELGLLVAKELLIQYREKNKYSSSIFSGFSNNDYSDNQNRITVNLLIQALDATPINPLPNNYLPIIMSSELGEIVDRLPAKIKDDLFSSDLSHDNDYQKNPYKS